jgi:prepilin-type N-terminal cleavage/methylation domain-containing protein
MSYSKKNRGYTLLELIIVIAIILSISGIAISLVVKSVHNYNDTVKRSLNLSEFDNAMLNFDSLCNSTLIISIQANCEDYLKTLGDNIVINYIDNYEKGNVKKKIIYFSDEKLRVKTISNDGNTFNIGYNILLNGVTEFKVISKDNLIYYDITTKWGGNRIRCI